MSSEEHNYQIFAIEEEGEKEKRVAPDIAHLRVVPAVINGIGEEEVLLDSGSQIVLMTKKVATANKVGILVLAFRCRVRMGCYLEHAD